VKDGAIALQLGSGHEATAEYGAISDDVPDFVGALSKGVKGLKIGWSPDLGGNPVDPEVVTVAEKAAKTFEELGATVESVDFNPSDYEEVFWSFFDYFAIKAVASNTDDVVNNRDQLTDYFGDVVDYAATLPATRMWEILGNIGWYRNYVNEFFGGYDLLLSPTLAVPAFKIGEQPEKIDGREVPHRLWGFTPFTYLFNLTGNPAASAPAGFSSGGLPIGLQIIGDMKDETTILAASAAFEEARPWADKRPPVS
jgi:aspartyl-tRNA(Asn)/glutamyl-tRNA(Gln) amidotransferase subunit A